MITKIYLKDDATELDLNRIQNKYFAHWFGASRDEKGIFLKFNGQLDEAEAGGLPGVSKVEYAE